MSQEMSFALALKSCRSKLAITQKELAIAAGLDHSYISLLERGERTPTLATTQKLAKALSMSTAELVNIAEDFLGFEALTTDNELKFLIKNQSSFFKRLLDTIADGIVMADVQGNLIYFNHAARTMFGVGRTDANIHDWTREYGVFLPDGLTLCPTESMPLVRAIRGEFPQPTQLFIKRLDEVGIDVLVNGEPIFNDARKIIGGVVFMTNISEKKSLALELNRVKTLIKHAYEETCIGFWERSIINDSLYWSEGMYKIYERSPDKPIATGVNGLAELYTPETYARLKSAIALSIKDKSDIVMELEVVLPDAHTKWVIGHSYPVFNDAGEVIGLRGIAFEPSLMNSKLNKKISLWRKQAKLTVRDDKLEF